MLLTQEEALNAGLKPIRKFMFEQTNRKDIRLFMEIEKQSNDVSIEKEDEIPTLVLIPAFMISELRIAFIIGFLIYLPFIVIDMVVASTLMSMGMMMLPAERKRKDHSECTCKFLPQKYARLEFPQKANRYGLPPINRYDGDRYHFYEVK